MVVFSRILHSFSGDDLQYGAGWCDERLDSITCIIYVYDFDAREARRVRITLNRKMRLSMRLVNRIIHDAIHILKNEKKKVKMYEVEVIKEKNR